MKKIIIGGIVLFIVYVVIRALLVLRPTNDIDVFLKSTRKKIKDLYSQAKRAGKLGPAYLEKVLKDATELRNEFIRDQIFNDKDLKPTSDQYRLRGELIEKMHQLENKLNKAISNSLEVH